MKQSYGGVPWKFEDTISGIPPWHLTFSISWHHHGASKRHHHGIWSISWHHHGARKRHHHGILPTFLRPGFLPELGEAHGVVSLALVGCSVAPGNPWARTCMTPFHPTAGWLFLATELSIRWEYAGDERCWPNHMGMAQNIESDTSIPYMAFNLCDGDCELWPFKLLNINLPNSTFQAGLNRNMLELNQCNTGFISLWYRANRS